MKIFSKRNLIWFLVVGLPFVASIIGYFVPNPFFPNREDLQIFLQPYGIWAPLLFVFLAIIPVVFTPLNHFMFALAGGAIFGLTQGMLFSTNRRRIKKIFD